MRALILGASGQDGSYLAEQLLADDYEIWGMVRRSRVTIPGVQLVIGDLLDQTSLEDALRAAQPDEVYNLAAVTAPGAGWDAPQPPLLTEVTGVGPARLCAAMLRAAPDARLVHASSSAVLDVRRYGPYGAAKLFAHETIVGYRGRLHCSNAVLYSHTSPRQDPRFLARRITTAAADIAAGRRQHLVLGDVHSRRDWGFAADYCRALPLIARNEPGDYTIATGRTWSVADLADMALAAAGLDWGVVHVDPDAPLVPHEVPPQELRLAASRQLGWKPETDLADVIAQMVEAACR
jgi:GDPmannose 4,6-dehydratase